MVNAIIEIESEAEAEAETAGSPVPDPAKPANAEPRVLLVDDDTTIRDVVSFMLERLHYSPVAVTNGKEALDAVLESEFSIVLMDVNMPEMNGIEATKQIRAQLSSDHQPSIIAMTAGSTFEEQFVCIKAGMNYFLPKPIRLEHLAAALETSGAGAS
jgi:CheY-like chemotaxis protein